MTTRYEVLADNTGKGGFGVVQKASDTHLERLVAIKTLDPIFKDGPTPDDVERFKREGQALARLSHPNIPAIYDIELSGQDGEFRIIFEWIEGQSLREVLTDSGVLSLEEARSMVTDVTSALSHVHGSGIVHRDVKPANILRRATGESFCLVDLGISLRKQEVQRITRGTPIGTPGYMSPEQELGEEVDLTTDLFSLGIVLYESLSGMRPAVGEYRPLSSQNEAIPPAIDELVKRCLQEPRLRPQSADDFRRAFDAALRPHGTFADTLAQGSLHEIQLAIAAMSPSDFARLPRGQRILVLTRLKDLLRVDDPRMRNAIAALLSELVRAAHQVAESDYTLVVEKGLAYGYEVDFSEKWRGNKQLRHALSTVALECGAEAHLLLSRSVAKFLDAVQDLGHKQGWYLHDLRNLLQNLLANGYCNDAQAVYLGKLLDRVNEFSH